MAAIPSGQDNYATGTRSVRVGKVGDIANGYPADDTREWMVPFGTSIFSGQSGGADVLGVILSGSLTNTSDRKTRSDGLGGTVEATHVNIRWEGSFTATFRLGGVTASGVDTEATAGVGPVKPGDLILLATPNSGETFTAPVATARALVNAMTVRLFEVLNTTFKFSDGEYATYDVNVIHEHSLHGDADNVRSAEVQEDGQIIQIQTEALNA